MQILRCNSWKVRASAPVVALLFALSGCEFTGKSQTPKTTAEETAAAERAALALQASREARPALESPILAPSAKELKATALERAAKQRTRKRVRAEALKKTAGDPQQKVDAPPEQIAITQAAPVANSQSQAEAPTSKKIWALSVDLGASSSFLESTDPDYSSSLSMTVIPSLKLGKGYTLSARTDFSQDIQPEEKFSWLNSSLTVRYAGFELNPFFTLSPAVTTTLPTNSEVRRRDGLVTSLNHSQRLLMKFDAIGLSALSGYLEVGGARLIHSFETKTNGALNNKWAFNLTSVTQLSLSEKLSLTLLLRRSSTWSYAGALRNSFVANPELGYQLLEKVSLSVGISTEGKLLKDNGNDSNFAIYDGRRSQFYGGLGFVF